MTIHRMFVGRLPAAMSRAVLAALTLLAVTALLATPAWAHVTANPGSAPAGESAVIEFRVPHGCDGSATTAISVRIPDTVAGVTPEFIPGWSIDTTTGTLSEPVELHGETVTEGTREIIWSGGPAVPDGSYFDFGVSMQLPDRPGETLYFPVVQTCESGEAAWIEIPAAGEDGHDLDAPAPSVTLTDGEGGGDRGASEPEDHSETASASEPVSTAELATSDQQSSTSILPVVLVVGGVGLAAALTTVLVARRRA